MPFELDLIGERSRPSYDFNPGGDWGWLAKQEFSYDRAWSSVGNMSTGKIGGGPSVYQQWQALDPKKFTILPSPPETFNPILAGERLGSHTRVGTVSLDVVDPFGTLGQLTGDAIGADKPFMGDEGTGFDPGRFLNEKNIDLFGQGETGVPARLLDYVLALPMAIINKKSGVTTGPDTGPKRYRFQMDPGYWGLLRQARDDNDLRELAKIIAQRYIDPYKNGALVEDLFQTFKSDQNQMTGLSSGNDRIDYLAKWSMFDDLVRQHANPEGAYVTLTPQQRALRDASTLASLGNVTANVVAGIPFIGTGIAKGVAPMEGQIEELWKGLTPQERAEYLSRAGLSSVATDFAVLLPVLSGIGSVLAIAKGAGGIASAAYKGYDMTLRASTALMASGLTVATINWGLEAAWPEYSELLGNEIDRARPISKSALAGVVNQVGFWSSGTFGAYTAVQGVSRGAGAVLGKAVELGHVPLPTWGPRELATFKFGYGGSGIRNELADAGLSPQGLDTSVKTSFLSGVLNWVERRRREPYEAAAKGGETPWSDVNLMTFEERQAWINDQLARGMQDGPDAAQALLRVMQTVREPRPMNPTDDIRAAYSRAEKLAATLDDELAQDVVRQYGPDFIASPRMAGAYTVDAMKAWSKAKVQALGGDPEKLGRHDLEGWAQIVRTLHQYEYHWWNGELAAAVEKEALEEAGKLAIIRSDHLFANDVDHVLEAIKGDEAAARAAVADLIRTRQEAADWFAKTWQPKTGVQRLPENVEPAVFAKWLEEIQPALPVRRQNALEGADTAMLPVNTVHRALDAEGTWTLAFKPVDEEGRFISYVRGSDGSVFKSPWVEYPMGSIDNIELGNHGMLQNKVDSIFRGFRTWRIAEFQRGGLFRSLTGRFDFLPAQVDQFHAAVLEISREAHVQPQTVGAVGKLEFVPFGVSTRSSIDAAAERIFGPGPYRARDGRMVDVDWADEISKQFQQAYKLNLSAGLTSHLKSRLGPAGAGVAYASDIVYPLWRFGLSWFFKGGELLESKIFNAQQGVIRGDPTTQALFVRGGLGNDYTLLNSEMAYDQLTRAITGRTQQWNASQRLAASLSFHARRLPEDFQLTAETASTHAAAEARSFRPAFTSGSDEAAAAARVLNDEWSWDPAKVQARVDNAEMVPTSLLQPIREIDWRNPQTPEGMTVHDAGYHQTLEELGADIEGNGVQGVVEVWWDPATNRAVLADGNHRLAVALENGIEELPTVVVAHTTEEIGQGYSSGVIEAKVGVVVPPNGILKPSEVWAAADQPIDLPPLAETEDELLSQLHATLAKEPISRPPVYTEEGGLYAELNELVGENGVYPGLEQRAISILKRLDEIEQEKGDGGPVMSFWDHTPERQEAIAARLADDGFLFHGSSDRPDVPDPRINNQAGFFTTTSFEDAAWYGSRRTGGAEMRGRPTGDVYVARQPHPTETFDATSPTGAIGVSTKMKEDVQEAIDFQASAPIGGRRPLFADAIAKVKRGEEAIDPDTGQPIVALTKDHALKSLRQRMNALGDERYDERWRAASAYIRAVERFDETWGAAANPDLAPTRARFNRIDQGLYEVAMARANYLRESGRSDIKAFDVSYVNELMDHFGYKAIRTTEPPMVVQQPKVPRIDQLKNELAAATRNYEGLMKGESAWPGMTDNVDLARGQVQNLKASLNEEIAVSHGPDIDVWIFRERPEVVSIDDAYAQLQRRPGAADTMDDIAGTPEAFERILRDTAKETVKRKGKGWQAWETFWHPTGYKQQKSLELQVRIMEREFPAMLRASGNDGLVQVFKSLGIREDRWARWLLEDRKLLDEWMNAKTPEAFDALVRHAGGDVTRREFDELYSSEEWQTISALWSLNLKSAQDEAFGVHFFMPYRSAFERSINHPVLGIYPASWALKAARQWVKFLYDNRTFGELRLGQSPAQAIANVSRAQATQFAMTNDESLDEFLKDGPLGSTIFIFNLMMPGDWSSLPFPLSRSIRELLRGTTDPAKLIQSNIDFMGVTRDARLTGESLGEMRDLIFGKEAEEDPQRALSLWSTRGYEANWPPAR